MRIRKQSYAALFALILAASTAPGVRAAVQYRFTGEARYGVYIASTETGQIRFYGGFYDWSLSPDGKWIAGDYDGNVSVVSVATGRKTFLRKYTATGPAHPEFAWSADSRWLRVSCDWNWDDDDERPRVDVLAVQPTSSKGPKPTSGWRSAPVARTTSLRVTGYDVVEAVLSPDRKRAAAVCRRGSYQRSGYDAGIFICSTDGSRRARVTRFVFRLDVTDYNWRTDAEDREMCWLPSGKGLVFRRTSHEDEGI